MPVSIDDFRAVMSRWTSGVTVVTTRSGEHVHGMVASSFTAVSTDPLTILFCADHRTRTYPLVKESGIFAVNVLASAQEDTFRVFAGQKGDPDASRFGGESPAVAVTGAPILPHSLAWLDCRVVAAHPGGRTHTIFVGEVLAVGLSDVDDEPPLVYFKRKVRHLVDASD